MARKRLFESEQALACTTCLSKVGQRCVNQFGVTTDYPHAARHNAWTQMSGEVQHVNITFLSKEAQT